MPKIIKLFIAVSIWLSLLTSLAALAFLRFSPQFGGRNKALRKQKFAASKNHNGVRFKNLEPIDIKLTPARLRGVFRAWRNQPKDIAPQKPLPSYQLDITQATNSDGSTKLTWLSHSSFLLCIDGKRILIDPMFGTHASPLPWLVKRFANTLPKNLEQMLHTLPSIDAVLISHDHYDHLDYSTIKRIHPKVKHFFVPLGVDAHLTAWGVPAHKITSFDWWQEAVIGQDDTAQNNTAQDHTNKNNKDIKIILCPARHSSGRGLTDQKHTLWGSWAIISKQHNIFFSGDGGYGQHFKTIGERFGDFDIALMECGQYNPNWKNMHMLPEESMQAAHDMGAKAILPIHWGAFVLSTHSWREPVERLINAIKYKNITVTTPRLGQTITLDGNPLPEHRWWCKY